VTVFPRLRAARRGRDLAQARAARASTDATIATANMHAALIRATCAEEEATTLRIAMARFQAAAEATLGVTGWCTACLGRRHGSCVDASCACTAGDHEQRTPVRRPDPVDDTIVLADLFPHDWWFTFYAEHTHPRTGAPLADTYVVIFGQRDEAETQMRKRFGDTWAHQYGSAQEAGVLDWALRQLKEPESLGVLAPASVPDVWPAPGAEEWSWLQDDTDAVRKADR
jgi:hypothetical protein